MMKILLLFALIVIAIIILFMVLGYISRSGKAPGMVEGKLIKCPAKPDCVCSEQKDDIDHYVDPLIIPQGTANESLNILRGVIQELGGAVQVDTGIYLAATFSSSVFGFVDDLELRIDLTHNVIHIRSASRVGYSDLGVNKKRVESMKGVFYEKVKSD